MKTRGKDLVPQLKNMVGMSAMRFCSRNFAIVSVRRKNTPGIFAHDVPLAQEFAPERDLSDHIKAGDHHKQRPLRSWVDVMKIIEKGQRNISRKAKRRELVDHHLSGRTCV